MAFLRTCFVVVAMCIAFNSGVLKARGIIGFHENNGCTFPPPLVLKNFIPVLFQCDELKDKESNATTFCSFFNKTMPLICNMTVGEEEKKNLVNLINVSNSNASEFCDLVVTSNKTWTQRCRTVCISNPNFCKPFIVFLFGSWKYHVSEKKTNGNESISLASINVDTTTESSLNGTTQQTKATVVAEKGTHEGSGPALKLDMNSTTVNDATNEKNSNATSSKITTPEPQVINQTVKESTKDNKTQGLLTSKAAATNPHTSRPLTTESPSTKRKMTTTTESPSTKRKTTTKPVPQPAQTSTSHATESTTSTEKQSPTEEVIKGESEENEYDNNENDIEGDGESPGKNQDSNGKDDEDMNYGPPVKKVKTPSFTSDEPSSGNFMAYFLTAVVLCVAGYVLFHNKQKIIAFIIEGRNGPGSRSRRPKTSYYKRLNANVEDVMPALEKSTTSNKYIY